MDLGMNPGAPVNNPAAGQYAWPCWWGGVTVSATPPLISTKVGELRALVGGIAAKRVQGGPQFPVRGAKELAQKLAQALHDLDMVAPVIAQEVTLVDTQNIPQNATSSGKPVFRTLAHVKATVRLGASDGSYVDMVGSGHGGDVDDKAGGKADTYGWKIALLKGLTIPEQDMVDTDDEQPSKDEAKPAVKPYVKTRDSNGFDNDKPTPAAPKLNKVSARAVPSRGLLPYNGNPELNEVLARIGVANEAELEVIKDEIKTGKVELYGADKLKATAIFVARKNKLAEEKRADGPSA